MKLPGVPFWKTMPALRILAPVVAGISMQWYFSFSLMQVAVTALLPLTGFIVLTMLSQYRQFRLQWLKGLMVLLFVTVLGAILTFFSNIKNDKKWVGHQYIPGDKLKLTLTELPVEKTKSLKAEAAFISIIRNGKEIPVKGKAIAYFDKTIPGLQYGTTFITGEPLSEIKNAGNPGGFDYKKYCLFNGITHQYYLNARSFVLLPELRQKAITRFLINTRSRVVNVLYTYITTSETRSLAAALLIGYKNDLEQNLVQSYTNTGVVHIIAISGLHLGIIYVILIWIFKITGLSYKIKWLPPLIVIVFLWLFSLLAGAQASVIRSAVMFTCIGAGTLFDRKGNILNTLFFSALALLIYNPFWLWDVGFQLSYAAVLSIVLFMQPIYRSLYFSNGIIRAVWQLMAVTLAAQVLTTPISIYHFHQFPLSFWLANIIAVPLSTILLVGLIVLCIISPIVPVAVITGNIITYGITFMNNCIQHIEQLPFALIDGMVITPLQVLLLYAGTALLAIAFINKYKPALYMGSIAVVVVFLLRTIDFFTRSHQQKIIVYNIPGKAAIDFIEGRNYFFTGNRILLDEGFLRNFHLKPSRILHRITPANQLQSMKIAGPEILFGNKRVLFADSALQITSTKTIPATVDLLVISYRKKINIEQLAANLDIKQVVADGVVPFWLLADLNKRCQQLGIPFHEVQNKGAFVLNIK